MYDNLLHQNVATQLEQDILRDKIPGALLFVGGTGCGKLTAALETARVLSCQAAPRGAWQCECPSCRRHKMLVAQNMMLIGSKDCTPEIVASKKTFLNAVLNNTSYVKATRYLFIRSVRKLTARFNPVIMEGDDKISKVAALLSAIDEKLELIDFSHEIPEEKKLEKLVNDIEKDCVKLESEFLPDSIPVRQIRNASGWAHIKSQDGKKTLIIENADKMLESVRNALLKILEEPPEDVVFILTATRRNAVMPTILSRVRTYQFDLRSVQQERDVISRVFHDSSFGGGIEAFFENFLPVAPETVRECAKEFYNAISENKIPDIDKVVKTCVGFEPRKIFRMFLAAIENEMRPLLYSAAGTAVAADSVIELRNAMNNVTVFNQQPTAALETLVRAFSKINKTYLARHV